MVNNHKHLHQEAKRANNDNVTSTGPTVLTVVYVTSDKPNFSNLIIGQPTTTDYNPGSTTQQASPSTDQQSPTQQAGAPNTVPSSTDSPSTVNFATQTSDSSSQQTSASAYQTNNLYTVSSVSSPTYAQTTSNYYTFSQTNTAVNAASTNSSSDSGSSNGGMSIGAKAGIAGGIIGAIGLILVVVLFALKRKQRNRETEYSNDTEKTDLFDSRAGPAATMSASAPTSSAAAPRLSLRPASSFLPEFIGGARNRNSQGNMLNAASGNGGRPKPGMLNQQASLESINEKPGSRENPFKDPENPFTDRKAFTPRSGPMSEPPTASTPAKSMAPLAAAAAGGLAVGAIAAAATKSKPSKESLSNVSTNSSQPRQETGLAPPPAAVPSPKPDSMRSESPSGIPNMAAVPGPRPESPSQGNVYRILMDFTPSMEDELELRAGQLVRLLHEYDDGWCLCTRLDRSQQGAVPRTCLAAKPSKPRPHPGGPGMGRPMSPGNMGRPMSPATMGRAMSPMGDPRAMSPTMGRAMSPSMGGLDERMNSPIDRAMSPSMGRPIGNMSSTMGRPMSPDDMAGPRNAAPSPQPRIGTSRPLSPGAYNRLPRPLSPGPVPQKRSVSPGPYGHAGGPPPMIGVQHRRRSNSAGALYLPNGRDSPSGQGRYMQGMGIAL